MFKGGVIRKALFSNNRKNRINPLFKEVFTPPGECVRKSPKRHRMHERVVKMTSAAWTSHQNDIGCVKKSSKWSRVCEQVAKIASDAWKSRQNDVGCVTKSSNWQRVSEKVANMTSEAWQSHRNYIGCMNTIVKKMSDVTKSRQHDSVFHRNCKQM